MKENNERATKHYRKALLKWRGLYAFQKLLRMKNDRMKQAALHHEMSLKRLDIISFTKNVGILNRILSDWVFLFQQYFYRSAFDTWQASVRNAVEQRNKMADEFNEYRVKKKALENWSKVSKTNQNESTLFTDEKITITLFCCSISKPWASSYERPHCIATAHCNVACYERGLTTRQKKRSRVGGRRSSPKNTT